MPPRKDLIMSKWIYTIKKGEALYSAIDSEDVTAITTLLVDICEEVAYSDLGEDVCEAWQTLADDINEDIDNIDIYTIDFWLNEFYDLADNSRVWVGQI